MHIECSNGSPMMNTLDHLPPLPLFVCYSLSDLVLGTVPTQAWKQDELGLYHALRLHGRIRHIGLELPPSILRKVLALMNENFPILERLSLTYWLSDSDDDGYRLPKAFLAPNLLHLTLLNVGLSKRLRVLTSTVSLVTLMLGGIQTSSYFRPRLLVARLRSLPKLEELSISFSAPIPRPSTERELLGEKGAPIILPSLKTLSFHGVGAYLESLVAQIRVPLLEQLSIRLYNQIAFVLPHFFYLINNTKVFMLSGARVGFYHDGVFVSSDPNHDLGRTPFTLRVRCKPLDWQIDCAVQICQGLIPALSSVKELSLDSKKIMPEMRNGAIDSATWHDLLRSFIGVTELDIDDNLSEELSLALQVDEVGLDPEFLPNLRSIIATRNLFTSFVDTRQVVDRPVQFETYSAF